MNLKFKNTEFWNSLHGQVPGMVDWDFENELGLSRTTDQNFSGSRHLQRRLPATPQQPQARKSVIDQDDPHIEPNLRMWVNPNIVFPLDVQGTPNPNPDPDTNPEPDPAIKPDPGPNPELDPGPKPGPEEPEPKPDPKSDAKPDPKPKSKPKSKAKTNPKPTPKPTPKPNPADTRKTRSKRPLPQPPTRNKGSSCSEATGAELPRSQHSKKKKSSIPSVKNVELTEKAGGAQKSSSAALQSSNKECVHQQKSGQVGNQDKKSWSRPPLNYGHLTALALKNSSPSGLNVQGIYSFVRQHFPFFQTAPGGWKNTIRHNLCFLGSFKKVPVNIKDGYNTRPRACLWMLTEEGHRRFHEETRPLAFARKQVIQKSMSNPEMISSLFNF